MNIGFTNMVTALGIGSFELLVVLVLFLGGLIFYAKDFKVGVVMSFLKDAAVFIWFYEAGLNFTLPLIMFFLDLVILAFTLYAVQKSAEKGVLI